MHGRLPWPRPDELDPARRAVYDAIAGGPRAAGPQVFRLTDDEGRLEGPFNAMLVSPGVGLALQELGAAVRYRTSLTDRAREIAILALAALRRSDFEWYAHERVGRRAGLSDDEMDAVRHGQVPQTLSDAERAVLEISRALTVEGDLGDDAYAEAEATLGREALAELVVLVGYYDLLALLLRVFRTPLPTGEAFPFETAVTR
ncbi:carboxymuconolactone decarboxylase family protein [Geodermatophilus sp. DF01-2]|uniref:carboxymuconolactone decarboxylase family protein n=1 Tax=Geodermatophilus sp. DF01-2 TaxID=2559610 RepID=UPI001074260C|nr:carboxymuconolactone decarboxylase family protein [Geodermatophilus sp. DF01_2]TFV56074.1 carboxymuconolactone decarboxylase family protein [Geodermatophilus sp. DF01_2]